MISNDNNDVDNNDDQENYLYKTMTPGSIVRYMPPISSFASAALLLLISSISNGGLIVLALVQPANAFICNKKKKKNPLGICSDCGWWNRVFSTRLP